jgi:hypothetical protein
LADKIAPVIPVRYTENFVNGFLPRFNCCIQRRNSANDLQENISMLAVTNNESNESDEENPTTRLSPAIN